MGGGAGTRSRLARFAERWRLHVADPVLSVLFPPRCVGCGDFESHLCPSCRDTLPRIGPDSCPRCGEPGAGSLIHGRCAHCVGRDVSYVRARSAFEHQGVARRMVADFKFGEQPVLGRIMAELAAPAFADYLDSAGCRGQLLITWVPCHRAAKQRRGYNQAEVLARALSRCSPAAARLPEPVSLLRKERATRHQKALGRADRQQNLRGAFVLDKRAVGTVPAGTRGVVLVDDVYTTGATANEVSSVISTGIGLPVYVFTFSRALASATERHD